MAIARFVQVKPHSMFAGGWIIAFQGRRRGRDGWCHHTAIGIIGHAWKNGQWLGGGSWERHGPVAVCRFNDPVRYPARYTRL